MELESSDSNSGSSSDYDFIALHEALLRGNHDKVQRILSFKRRDFERSRVSKRIPRKSRSKTKKSHKQFQHKLQMESRIFVRTCEDLAKIQHLVQMLLSETKDGYPDENRENENHAQTLRLHLAKEQDLVNMNWKGLTLLHLASFKGRSDDVATLLTYGADANSIIDKASWEADFQDPAIDQNSCLLSLDQKIKDEYLTPVMIAASEGHLEVVAQLIKNGALTETDGIHSGLHIKTPLFYAVEKSLFNLVQLLINCGAQVDAREQWEQKSLLHVVQDADMARQLVNCGLNVNARDKKGATPLHCAAACHNIKVAEVLLEYKADINAEDEYGETPLYHALNGRCTPELIQFLINHGSGIKHETKIERRTPLHELIMGACCSYDVLNLLLESGSEVNAVDSDGKTALHIAIEATENFSFDVVKLLVDNEADVNIADRFGQLPLHLACGRGDCDTVLLLLDRGSDINRTTNLGMLPLHYSVRYGNTENVKILSKRGSNLNRLALEWREEGNVQPQLISALSIAVSQKNYDSVKVLLESGADVNIRDEYGSTALHYAVEIGWTKGIGLLLENRAELNFIGGFHKRTAIHIAVKRNLLDVLEMLVKHGADVNAIDHGGSTALHYAARMGAVEIVKFLLDNGANVKAFTDSTWSTPLHVAATVNSPAALRLLIKYGSDLNTIDGRNKTALDLAAQFGLEENARLLLKSSYKKVDKLSKAPSLSSLHYAARHSSSNILKMLIRQGYSVNATDQNGKTPLHCASEFGCEENVRILLAHGSNVNAVTSCCPSTPLHLIARKNCPNTLQLLIDSGADVKAIDDEGNTPLHCAVGHGSVANARVLITNGGDNSKQNNYGFTPLDLAVARDRRSMEVEVILRETRKKRIFPLTLQWVTSALTCCKNSSDKG